MHKFYDVSLTKGLQAGSLGMTQPDVLSSY